MADIFDVCDIVERMADGFQPAVLQCLSEHADLATDLVREQMCSGVDGDERLISPNYDNDPFFDVEGSRWYKGNERYKQWKKTITPAVTHLLTLPVRPDNIPNLYINGQFYSDVFSSMEGDVLRIGFSSENSAPDIVAKYGDRLLALGPTAIGYFNEQFTIPAVWRFFEDCGY